MPDLSPAALPSPITDSADLDPADWPGFRAGAHVALDLMLDHLQTIREQPVWRPTPPSVRAALRAPLPEQPQGLAAVVDQFDRLIRPYATGNLHPRFMGWVHGGGTPVGMVAEMLAGGLNANLGGRDHAPILVERQVIGWMAALFGLPQTAGGLLVTGTSIANLIGVLIARRAALGPTSRASGLGGTRLVAYTSAAAHGCLPRAMDYAGLGSDALRRVPVDGRHRIDLDALRRAVAADRAAGATPFLVIGTAGTVDIGAIDDLAALADLAAAERLWFHVDGAFGALGVLTSEIAPRLSGIERAQSLALDFHKWAQVPYDAGFVLVRDGALHRDTFATSAEYLRREARGLAGGTFWPNDFGPDLSRGFRALKTWFTLRVYGTEQLGAMIAQTCRVARHLAARVAAEPRLELLAPAPLNIVCFRYRGADADALNAAIVADVQESGVAAPSTTRIDGALAIRAAIFNHRTRERDVDALVDAVLRHGDRRVGANSPA